MLNFWLTLDAQQILIAFLSLHHKDTEPSSPFCVPAQNIDLQKQEMDPSGSNRTTF